MISVAVVGVPRGFDAVFVRSEPGFGRHNQSLGRAGGVGMLAEKVGVRTVGRERRAASAHLIAESRNRPQAAIGMWDGPSIQCNLSHTCLLQHTSCLGNLLPHPVGALSVRT